MLWCTSNKEGYFAIKSCFSPFQDYTLKCSKYGYDPFQMAIRTDSHGKRQANIFLMPSGTENVVPSPSPIIYENENVTELIIYENMTPNIQYIWAVSGIEPGTITMALHQEGLELYGQAKYEPETDQSWNGAVSGSIFGNHVQLVLSTKKNGKNALISLDGSYENDTISGEFSREIDGQITACGSFNANWITSDISVYTEAVLEGESKENRVFVDVRVYKDKISPSGDLSGVPP